MVWAVVRNDAVQTHILSDRFSKQTTIVAIIVFLIFGSIAPFVLPGRFSFDASNMADIAQDLIIGNDPSFNVIAGLIRIFSLPGLTVMVQAGGVGVIIYLISSRRFVSTMAIALFSIALAAALSLVRPQKELLVLLLSAACVAAIIRCKTERRALFVCVIAYAVYLAVSLRPYYILIIGVIAGLSAFSRLSRPIKCAVVMAIAIGGFFIPAQIFDLLRLSRDAVNEFRVFFPEVPGNRSAFFNPLQDPSWIGFLGNYIYAIVRLNFPLLFSQTPSEAVLTLYAGLWFYVMWVAGRAGDWRARLSVRLMMSHLLVLWIFEPDLGSYLRHFSSCVLYLGPMLLAVESRWLARQWTAGPVPSSLGSSAALA